MIHTMIQDHHYTFTLRTRLHIADWPRFAEFGKDVTKHGLKFIVLNGNPVVIGFKSQADLNLYKMVGKIERRHYEYVFTLDGFGTQIEKITEEYYEFLG